MELVPQLHDGRVGVVAHEAVALHVGVLEEGEHVELDLARQVHELLKRGRVQRIQRTAVSAERREG